MNSKCNDREWIRWAWIRLISMAKSEDRPGSSLAMLRNVFGQAVTSGGHVTEAECEAAMSWIDRGFDF